jgi:hypothetical protein
MVGAPVADTHKLPERPYKFLDYYDYSDRGVFEGRASETGMLALSAP